MGWFSDKTFYTLIGADFYVSFYGIQTYALVGEWFTAIIVLIYLLYPLLNALFERCRLITTLVIFGLYLLNLQVDYFVVPDDANAITCIWMFWIGMLICEYESKILNEKQKYKTAGCIAIAALVLIVKLPWRALL